MAEEGSVMLARLTVPFQIDPAYEFSAPMYFDFCAQETSTDVETAEGWFATAVTYEASPHAAKSKECSILSNGDDSCQYENDHSQEHLSYVSPTHNETAMELERFSQVATNCDVMDTHQTHTESAFSGVEEEEPHTPENGNVHHEVLEFVNEKPSSTKNLNAVCAGSLPVKRLHSEAWKDLTNGWTASKSTLKAFTRPTQASVLKKTKLSNKGLQPDVQAAKKQKLEGGRFHKIHQSQPRTPTLTVPQEFHLLTDKRAQQQTNDMCSKITKVGRSASPFVSIAEKVRRFQMKTPERFRHHPVRNDEMLAVNEKPKLKLTTPLEPEFETSHRARPPKVKSTAELEAEMLAKIPKFKARPVNKKILEGPCLPVLPKKTPQLPQFQEFHLRTMERALQHSGGPSSVCSSDSHTNSLPELKQRRKSAPGGCLTEPQEPRLETASRSRPSRVKSTAEMEEEELAKIPKFKARPFNKKIFESRGDLGIFRTEKRQVTTPSEFHFATERRSAHQTPMLVEKLNELSLDTRSDQDVTLRPTVPQPFHLATEERGLMKEMKLMEELMDRELADKEARIPKANPLPFTTDWPLIPPKPEPKASTKPEPFQLESLARHEEEVHRKAEELARLEQAEAEMRKFKAQPLLSTGPVFIPERSRKPLTEVQEFSLLVDTRAVERAEFDKKLSEKQNHYKRFREELEAARKVEEERFIKTLRKEMVPQARPMPIFAKPFVPQRSSKTPTRPMSPRLRTRKERRRSITLSVQKRSQMR
ncbi:hypothetical protein O6H91_07G031300 [Diphasiastrum complanatum]|uniref:Uncharacterized protein n=1 Tax=Diphasiastrum complanatum TaxID=34168 RepID=A0ACC2D4E9_DIPCM|nr:hypothetical protein O6H91_07G031300 [Diphasiastrum complanatum]